MISGASPCPLDQITIKAFQKSPAIQSQLLRIIYHCWKHKVLPSCWRNAVAALAYKKGSLKDPSNFRPISLEPVLLKFYHSVIREFTIGQREWERQSKTARSRYRPCSRFNSLRCNNWNAKDEMPRIISKAKQTWQEQVLIKLCCWMRIAQKQSMTRNFFYSMISIRVQICIYHIGNMTAFHWRTWMTTNVRQNLGSLEKIYTHYMILWIFQKCSHVTMV